jgi:hypothetical protein
VYANTNGKEKKNARETLFLIKFHTKEKITFPELLLFLGMINFLLEEDGRAKAIIDALGRKFLQWRLPINTRINFKLGFVHKLLQSIFNYF